MRDKVTYDAESASLNVREPLTQEETILLRDVLPPADHAAVEQYWQWERAAGTAAKALDEYAKAVRVPQLVVRDAERSYLFRAVRTGRVFWNLHQCDAAVPEAEFSTELNVGSRVLLGLTDQGGVRIGGIEQVMARQLSFVAEGDDWSKAELVRWLDREIHHGGAMAGLARVGKPSLALAGS